MPDLNAILAPRPLQLAEVASVIAPHMIVYGLAHRAFTHAYVWDEGKVDGATLHAAEEVLTDVIAAARSSLNDWLADMENDNEPRFYRKDGVAAAIRLLCEAAGAECAAIDNAADVTTWVQQVEDRESRSYESIIKRASD